MFKNNIIPISQISHDILNGDSGCFWDCSARTASGLGEFAGFNNIHFHLDLHRFGASRFVHHRCRRLGVSSVKRIGGTLIILEVGYLKRSFILILKTCKGEFSITIITLRSDSKRTCCAEMPFLICSCSHRASSSSESSPLSKIHYVSYYQF